MTCNFSAQCRKRNGLLSIGTMRSARALCTIGLIAAAFSPCVSGAAINIAVFESGTYTLDGGNTFIIVLDTCPRQNVTLQDGTQAGVPTCRVPLAAGDNIVGFDLLINEPAKDGGGLSDVMRFRDVGGAFTFQFMSDVDPGEGPPLDVGLPQGSTNAKTVDEIGEDNFSYTFQTAFGNNVNVSGAPEPGTFVLLLVSVISLALLRLKYMARLCTGSNPP
jgi:hypothetical protein